jgi:hypothetical protein
MPATLEEWLILELLVCAAVVVAVLILKHKEA